MRACMWGCVPAAEKGLGPAAASLADARVPWMGAAGPGMNPVPVKVTNTTINTSVMPAHRNACETASAVTDSYAARRPHFSA